LSSSMSTLETFSSAFPTSITVSRRNSIFAYRR
jgi:hypothetical protein